MQAPGVENMWNRYNDWQDPWKESHSPWKDTRAGGMNGWYEHPSGQCGEAQYDNYSGWHPSNSNGGYGGDRGHNGHGQHNGMGNSVAQLFAAAEQAQAAAQGSSHQVNPQMSANHHMGERPVDGLSHLSALQPHHGGYGGQRNQLDHQGFGRPMVDSSSHGQAIYGQNDHGGPSARGGVHQLSKQEDEDRLNILKEMEDSVRCLSSPLKREPQSDSEDEDSKQPAEATEQEREEAEEIVKLAFKQAKERDRLRDKVKKGISPQDLQAMLNARLQKK
eukprot:TRINITY_DN97993_c0_g1_i1.p1 TRINITY_DN97993_c0_g1~~TRINITY_DN97993_c0_g1_i1.p1  ORF type:complete len:276 (+),score=55.43 TRINITY_DN97993_c0_g1_i1:72-899(+)